MNYEFNVRNRQKELKSKQKKFEFDKEIENISELGIIDEFEFSKLKIPFFYFSFVFTLKKPYISADDEVFYVIDNSVKKEKVFKIPMCTPSSWKGNLRWTMMKIFLQDKAEDLSDKEFAKERFKQTLLFGTEKGQEEDKGWADYLNNLKEGNNSIYLEHLKKYFNKKDDNSFNLKGRLYFYPTFFNKLEMEIFNPHDRKTKTNRNLVNYEFVPKKTEGKFSLLYILPMNKENQTENEMKENYFRIMKAVEAMFLIYGFSAKKSQGFGTAKDTIKSGKVISSVKIDEGFEKSNNLFQKNLNSLTELCGDKNE